MDECIILLILVIIVATLIVFSLSETAGQVMLGGAALLAGGKQSQSKSSFTPDRKLFISDYAKLVVDGHNMIHQISHQGKMDITKFEDTLKDISQMIIDAYPTQDLHIVIKNPSEERTKVYNKMKNSKKNNPDLVKKKGLKKSSEERIPYFRELVTLSKKYPRITYHLAFGKESKKAKGMHHLKSRDDFLTIYLSRNGYMVSNDRFRDFKQFSGIKAFKHYSVTDGVVRDKETIKPISQYSLLETPNLGNHLIFDVLDKKDIKQLGIQSGDIYLSEGSAFGKMYLSRLDKKTTDDK